MQDGAVITLRTDKDSHFTGALATGAGEAESLTLPAALAGGQCRVRAIQIISKENLYWEVVLFGANTFTTPTDYDLYTFLGRKGFLKVDGTQIAAAGPFLYHADGLNWPYQSDALGMHVLLVNRDAAGKSAGAAGQVVVVLSVEPG